MPDAVSPGGDLVSRPRNSLSTEAVQEASMQGARTEHTCWYVTDEQRSRLVSCAAECQGISGTGHEGEGVHRRARNGVDCPRSPARIRCNARSRSYSANEP